MDALSQLISRIAYPFLRIAMGIVLVYRSSRVINFAVGSIGIPAAALFAVMAGVHGWPYWPSLILSLILGTLTGVLVELAVIRRLFKSPRVIVLDEPNAHLDSDGEQALVQMLLHCKSNGITSFIVAHRSGVLGVVDRILVLTAGQVALFGPKDEVLAQLSGRGRDTNAIAGVGA